MSEQDTDANYLALALVLTRSKNDHDLLKKRTASHNGAAIKLQVYIY